MELDSRTENEKWADTILDGIAVAVTTRVRAMLEEDLARLRPALVAGFNAGAGCRLLSPYVISDAFPPIGEDAPAAPAAAKDDAQ